jgi:hypothetical protein
MDNIHSLLQTFVIFKWHFAFAATAAVVGCLIIKSQDRRQAGKIVAYKPLQTADEDSFFDQQAS